MREPGDLTLRRSIFGHRRLRTWIFYALPLVMFGCRRGVPTPMQDAATRGSDVSARRSRFEGPPAHGRAIKGSDPVVVVLSSHTGPDDRNDSTKVVQLVAYDSSSLKQLWLTPLRADLGVSTRYELLLVGERIVVHHRRPQVDLFDLRNGALVSTVALSDNVSRLCDKGPNVFVDVADHKHVMLDTTTGGTRPAEEPTWCRPICDFDEGQKCFFGSYDQKVPELDTLAPARTNASNATCRERIWRPEPSSLPSFPLNPFRLLTLPRVLSRASAKLTPSARMSARRYEIDVRVDRSRLAAVLSRVYGAGNGARLRSDERPVVAWVGHDQSKTTESMMYGAFAIGFGS